MSTKTPDAAVHVTMIKKRLADGQACGKCVKAESMLKERGLWTRVDEVVWALEDDPDSAGVKLGEQHGVDKAPFFIVESSKGTEIFQSILSLIREMRSVIQPPRNDGSGPITDESLEKLARGFSDQEPQAIIRWALERFGADCAIAFSGAEDVALVDMAARTDLPYSVFCLDTGRLHSETYRFIDKVRDHYKIDIRIMTPDAERLEPFVRQKGLFSFYEDGHQECCGVRKVEPLRRALSSYRAWIAGQRKDQSPATRSVVPLVMADPSFEGKDDLLVKLNPLSNWTSAETWSYIRDNNVPYNELHERGFVSIGCEPCTRPVNPGQHEREGRWWWEEATKKECGLHTDKPTTEYSI